ncbi:MAG: CCDC34 family protein [Prevotella sp.]|nr:CCDC34 family protein [Prevotella sp.]
MWLRFHIAETFAFLGIYDTASKLQVVQTAELILDHELFAQMNLSEFLMFLKYFKRGDFGKIYQSARPNPQEFLSCLRPFWNDLVEYRIKLSKAEQEKRQAEMEKKGRENAMTHEEWIEIKTITAMYNSDYTVP